MGFNSCFFVGGNFTACDFFRDATQKAADALAEENRERDLMHWRTKVRRDKGRAALLKASTAMHPAPEPEPPKPDPVLVEQLARKFRNVRRTQGTTSGWGPGIWLPPI